MVGSHEEIIGYVSQSVVTGCVLNQEVGNIIDFPKPTEFDFNVITPGKVKKSDSLCTHFIFQLLVDIII